MITYNIYAFETIHSGNFHWFDRMAIATPSSPSQTPWTINNFGSEAWMGNSDGTTTHVFGSWGGLSFNASGHLRGTIT